MGRWNWKRGGKPPKILETVDTSVDERRQQSTVVDRQTVDKGRQPTTKTVRGKQDNTNPKQISWIRVALNQIVMVLMIIHCVTARIVWGKTPLRVNQGFQDVTFLAHYLLPCQNGTSIYKHRLSQRQLNVTARFETWCETYTGDVIHVGVWWVNTGNDNAKDCAFKLHYSSYSTMMLYTRLL